MKTKSTTITTADTCDWTRPRLPLYVGMGVESEPGPSSASTAERGDLSRADRLRIEEHLDACGDCRKRRSALARATGARLAAANEAPVVPHARSRWGAVAARIEASEAAPPSFWSRLSQAALPASARSLTDRAARRLDRLRDGLPLQFAWVRDTIQHDLPDRLRTVLDRDARSARRLGGWIIDLSASPAGLTAAAAVAVFITASTWAHRWETASQARTLAVSAPIPIELQTVPLVLAPPRVELPTVVDDAWRADEPKPSASTELEIAQSSAPLQPPPPPSPVPVPVPVPVPAPAKPTAVRHYDHDLEYGVPMPPDSRIAKPAY
jgi:hypothetical protein